MRDEDALYVRANARHGLHGAEAPSTASLRIGLPRGAAHGDLFGEARKISAHGSVPLVWRPAEHELAFLLVREYLKHLYSAACLRHANEKAAKEELEVI